MRVLRPAVLLVLCLLPFRIAAAQPGQPGVGSHDLGARASGVVTNGNGSECLANSMVSTSMQTRSLSVAVHSAPITQATRFGTSTPVVSLGAQSPDHHSWRVRVLGAIGNVVQDCVMFSGMTRAYAQVARRVGRGEVVLGYGYRGLSHLDPSRDLQGLGIGVRQQLRLVLIAFDVRSSNRTLAFSREHETRRMLDLRTNMQFAVGRVHFSLSGGGATGRQTSSDSAPAPDTILTPAPTRGGSRHRTQLWTRLDARVPVFSGLTIVAGVAALPVQPALDAKVRGVYSLGVSLARWPGGAKERSHAAESTPMFVAVRDDSTRVRFRVRLPAASTVRVSGEPTRWVPVAMVRGKDGWWETALPVAPGTYRMNVSIDNAVWSPPPGVPVSRDEFGGLVGLVTVR